MNSNFAATPGREALMTINNKLYSLMGKKKMRFLNVYIFIAYPKVCVNRGAYKNMHQQLTCNMTLELVCKKIASM